MSEIGDAIQEKCMSFADRIIKLNDYLLDQAANKMYDGGRKKYDGKSRQTSNIKHHTSHVPVYLQSVSNLCNQLLRAGTSIGANNAEPTNEASAELNSFKLCLARRRKTKSTYKRN